MSYKYYFIIYSGVYTFDSQDVVTSMQLGSKEDLEAFHSDAMSGWENFRSENTDDPQIWDRSDESDTILVLGRGNDSEVLTTKFYEAIQRRLGYKL